MDVFVAVANPTRREVLSLLRDRGTLPLRELADWLAPSEPVDG
ncbi:MAG TPA: hypothetical protein VJT31_39015 [Rugosimonospora sp.]|nr:hypothetical protein [Rugosimonospora sp.]